MSKLQEIQVQLADTKAAVARLEQAVAGRPESSSLRVNLRALLKRQRDLEQQLRQYQGIVLPATAPLEVGPHRNE